MSWQVHTLVLVLSCILETHAAFAQNIGLPNVDAGNDSIDLLENELAAWRAEDGRQVDNWYVRNGILVNHQPGSHLISQQKFRDFDLCLEFLLPRGGNSGVYLRGRYEVQLYDDGPDVSPKNSTGAIWGQIPVESKMFKGPNKWNELAVRIKGNAVTVLVNRKPVIRSQQLSGPTRGAIDQSESAPGPILLQSLRGVKFRKIYLKEL